MNADPDASPGPVTDMLTAAIAGHEYFRTLHAAGFSRAEALYITAAMMTGGIRTPPPGMD